jgi:hypothetical protein
MMLLSDFSFKTPSKDGSCWRAWYNTGSNQKLVGITPNLENKGPKAWSPEGYAGIMETTIMKAK